MTWPFKAKPKKHWAHIEWRTDGGDWYRDIESDTPIVATVSDHEEQVSVWVDLEFVGTVFFAQAKPGTVAVAIDQRGSKIEVNP